MPKTILDVEKDLEGLEIIIQDGFLKDCLVYHQAAKTLVIDSLKEILEGLKIEVPELSEHRCAGRCCLYCHLMNEIKEQNQKIDSLITGEGKEEGV